MKPTTRSMAGPVDAPGLVLLVILAVLFAGCAGSGVESEAPADVPSKAAAPRPEKIPKSAPAASVVKTAAVEHLGGPEIEIRKDSPADTVRAFYKRLREGNYRAAIKLTNLRPAIEGLTDDEMKDLGVDFRQLGQNTPEEMPINGEIVTSDTASVTVKARSQKTGKIELQEIRLRKESGYWIMLVADEEGERMVRKEGKNYFFALRMEVHHREARAMLERINKAQTIYSLKNGGKFADLETLVAKGYVPPDALTSTSTGYDYAVALAFDSSTYTALATPAVYRRTGKLSFAMRIRRGRDPELAIKDAGGSPLRN